MPGQSGRDLSLAPALKREADSRVMVASSVQLTPGSMWFDGSLVIITEVVGLLDVPRFRQKEVLLDYNFLHSYSGGVQEQ